MVLKYPTLLRSCWLSSCCPNHQKVVKMQILERTSADTNWLHFASLYNSKLKKEEGRLLKLSDWTAMLEEDNVCCIWFWKHSTCNQKSILKKISSTLLNKSTITRQIPNTYLRSIWLVYLISHQIQPQCFAPLLQSISWIALTHFHERIIINRRVYDVLHASWHSQYRQHFLAMTRWGCQSTID